MNRHAICALGLDIGGTAIKAGVVDADLRILATAERPTPGSNDPADVIDALVSMAAELRGATGDAPIAAAGVGMPGRVEPDTGVVVACANLRGWDNVPLGPRLTEALGVPVTVHNDANAAAFGEFARLRRDEPDLNDFALLTVGTGIGGGVVLGGRLVVGANQMAGEIGHMVVQVDGEPCPCGQRGCLERYAAAPAICRAATPPEESSNGDANAPGHSGGSEPLSAEQVFERAAAGDAHAAAVIDRAAHYLGVATINLARLLDLPCIFLGGGVAKAGDALLQRVRNHHQNHTWRIPTHPPRLELARLGNDAGWLGAAALAMDSSKARCTEPARASEQR